LLSHGIKKVFQVPGKRPQLSIDSKIEEFDAVIGSDGFSSIVRKSLRIKDPKFYLGIYTYVNKKDDSDTANVWPLKNGFTWVIPRGANIEYGVVESMDNALIEFKKFCKKKRVPAKNIHSYVIPSGMTEVARGRIALSGDAAGINKPFSFGGVIWGLTADSMLLKYFPNFQRYQYEAKRFFEPKIFFSKVAERIGRYFGDKFPFLMPKETHFDSDWVF